MRFQKLWPASSEGRPDWAPGMPSWLFCDISLCICDCIFARFAESAEASSAELNVPSPSVSNWAMSESETPSSEASTVPLESVSLEEMMLFASLVSISSMAITATERSGRFNETLKWGGEFDRIIPPSDPDWAPVRLRLAEIYRRGNQTAEWKSLLADVVKKKPNTVYSRMAQQSLESNALDQRLQNYLTKPPPQ